MPTQRPWYQETIADDSDITFVRPYLDEQTKTVLTTMAKRLSDGVSVIALDVTLSYIQEVTQEIALQTPGSFGIVLDKSGYVIAHSDSAVLGKDYPDEKKRWARRWPGGSTARPTRSSSCASTARSTSCSPSASRAAGRPCR